MGFLGHHWAIRFRNEGSENALSIFLCGFSLRGGGGVVRGLRPWLMSRAQRGCIGTDQDRPQDRIVNNITRKKIKTMCKTTTVSKRDHTLGS